MPAPALDPNDCTKQAEEYDAEDLLAWIRETFSDNDALMGYMEGEQGLANKIRSRKLTGEDLCDCENKDDLMGIGLDGEPLLRGKIFREWGRFVAARQAARDDDDSG